MTDNLFGIIIASISAFIFALFYLLSKISVNKSKYPVAVSVLFQMLAGIVSLFFVLQDGMQFKEIGLLSWGLLLISTVCYGMGNVYGFRAGKVLDVSITSILGESGLIIGFAGSLIVFNESATLGKIIGVIMILLGNFIVVGFKKKGKLDYKAVFLKIFASLLFGLANVIDGANSKNFPLSFYVFVGYFFGGVISMVFSDVKFSMLVDEFKSNKWGQIGMAVTASLGYFLFLTSFKYTQKTIAIPLSYTSAVIAVVMGIVILKEKNDLWRKLVAVAIVFTGSVLLSV